MAVINMPTTLRPAECSIGQQRYDLVEVSDSTGDEAARLLGPPRWTQSMASADHMSLVEAGTWASFDLQTRGKVNVVAAFDPVRLEPEGTLRGSPRLAADVAIGAISMTLIGGTNGTLLQGDRLQIGTGLGSSQLVQVVADAVSTPATATPFTWSNGGAFSWTNGGAFAWFNQGLITVTFEPPTRLAFAKETALNWLRPLAYYRRVGDSARWTYSRGARRRAGGHSIDLLETFS
jgi:hypothetical protein